MGGFQLAHRSSDEEAMPPAVVVRGGRTVQDEATNSAHDFLSVQNVSAGYVREGTSTGVLHDVSFTVEEASICILIGKSGCGKSTLLRVIGGFIRATGGEIALAGERVTGPGPDRMMVFQEFEQLLPWKTARENVAFVARKTRRLARAAGNQVADEVLRLVGLEDAAGKYPSQLSGGMQQRVAIARALAASPRLILMDEPFGALDAQTRARLQEELWQLAQATNLTVIFVTHSIEEAVFLGHRIIVMGVNGRITQVIANQCRGERDTVGAADLHHQLREALAREGEQSS